MRSTLISIVEAATLIQPFVGDINAMNLMIDWRRRQPRYIARVLKPPFFVKKAGRSARVRYPRSEIDRVIKEILALKMLSGSL